MADHYTFLLMLGGRGSIAILPFELPSRHQDHNVINVSYVGDHLQSVIHHGFLSRKGTQETF